LAKNKSHNVGESLNRLKKFLKIRSDRDLSIFLGLSENTISMWRQRYSFDFDLILEKCPDISIDFLLSGVPPETITERNNILNFYQVPLLQMDSDYVAKMGYKVEKIDPSERKILDLESEIKKIYELLKK
jgi:hypothetical protein